MFSLSSETISTFRTEIISWFRNNGRPFPWRNTRNPYRVLISEILLQRTRAVQVVPVYLNLISSYPDIFSLSVADENDLSLLITPLGLRKRTRYLIDLAEEIVRRFDGVIPSDKNELISLPGIGTYTAHAVLSFAFNLPYPVVDSTVIRVFRRFLNLSYPGHKPNRKIMEIAEILMDNSDSRLYNYGLLDFAADVCSTYNPECTVCPVSRLCANMLSSKS
ncbi:A/G-specific adenine glycosylase [Desulfohalotomaculum tongense]|uniref:A/G-specific adenine glycosylase n=1 Tax=Desulforadius tongensis TaxID=1216062 RepID=UPI001958A732|nr:A/G-specific adenine glycosylase [Desulforadius tongensis]